MPNLIEGIQQELKRNQELLEEYKKIPTGAFGAMMIQADIDRAEKAIADDDIVEMVKAYEALKESS